MCHLRQEPSRKCPQPVRDGEVIHMVVGLQQCQHDLLALMGGLCEPEEVAELSQHCLLCGRGQRSSQGGRSENLASTCLKEGRRRQQLPCSLGFRGGVMGDTLHVTTASLLNSSSLSSAASVSLSLETQRSLWAACSQDHPPLRATASALKLCAHSHPG